MTTPGAGAKGATVHVAMLRGINLAGKNSLPMKELVAIFVAAGAADVRTYIQSGNVVYRASATLAGRLPALVSAAIEARYGYDVPVVTRSARELRAVLGRNPFLDEGVDPKGLHVSFLAARPAASLVAGLDPDRSPTDRFVVRGREIFLHCPNGIARTRLTNQYFDSRLATISTMRNWATVLKLAEMTGAVD